MWITPSFRRGPGNRSVYHRVYASPATDSLPHCLRLKLLSHPILMPTSLLTVGISLAKELARSVGSALVVRSAVPECPACAPVVHCPGPAAAPECRCEPTLTCPALAYSPSSAFHQEGAPLGWLLLAAACLLIGGFVLGQRFAVPRFAAAWAPERPAEQAKAAVTRPQPALEDAARAQARKVAERARRARGDSSLP